MKLVIWDIDGTLVDSHAMIMDSMAAGMAAAGLAPLPDRTVSSIVGLSLPVAVETLLPGHDPATRHAVVEGYRSHYGAARGEGELSGGPGEERVADSEDELAFQDVEGLVEVVPVQWWSWAARRDDVLADAIRGRRAERSRSR